METVTSEGTVEGLRRIVECHNFERWFADHKDVQADPTCEDPDAGLLVDVQTARVLLAVHDAFEKDANREKFARMIATPAGIVLMAEFAWERVA